MSSRRVADWQHEGDVFISDLAVASHYIEQEGISNLRVVGDSGFRYEMGFAIRKDWPLLHSVLEKALGQISDEERRAIYNKWISVSPETEKKLSGMT